MKYLSIDIESTGLEENAKIIQFAAVPFDTSSKEVRKDLGFFTHIKCPSFEELSPTLSPWVRDNNEKLIRMAHTDGVSLLSFKENLESYVNSPIVKEFFKGEKIVLFGKSLSAIDLPFLTRDLSYDFMRKMFHHRNLDLSSVGFSLKDAGLLPAEVDSGSSALMKYLQMGAVQHTALEDAINTANMYLKLLDKIKESLN